jgi:hypothetical protein
MFAEMASLLILEFPTKPGVGAGAYRVWVYAKQKRQPRYADQSLLSVVAAL